MGDRASLMDHPGGSSDSSSRQPTGGEFLLISDIHFDPFFDGALFTKLDAQPVENWAEILGKSQPGGFSPMGTDSNYTLLKSSLDDAQRRIPAPDFLIYPGDFLAHNWQSKYDQLVRTSHLVDSKSYRAFTSKVVRFLANEFRRRYPDTPILPTLGNDDSYCGDYMITPDGPFLEMFAETWAPLLGPGADRDAFRATFTRGGHYSLKLPRAEPPADRAQHGLLLDSLRQRLWEECSDTGPRSAQLAEQSSRRGPLLR